MEKMTVLVAVWNAEEYLPRCLESLRSQTLADIQVVCVDDGSTDGSWEVIKSFSELDKRIEAIRLKQNHGQAHARNVALQRARAPYTCFLDSDDWLSEDALERAVSTFEENPSTDCVLFRAAYCEVDGTFLYDYPMDAFESLLGEEAFRRSLTWAIHGIYAVRTDLHLEYPYDESAMSYSDDNTTRLHYLRSREVRTCGGTYYYRQHADSVTHRVSIRRFDYLKANTSMHRQLVELGVGEDLLDVYENERWLNCVGLYGFYRSHRGGFTPEERAYGLGEIRKVWESIDPHRLRFRNRWKFGYMPLRCSFRVFCWQEEVYFALRAKIKRLRRCGGGRSYRSSDETLEIDNDNQGYCLNSCNS